VTREELTSFDASLEHERLRDAFEESCRLPLDLSPAVYVVWLEERVIAKDAPLTYNQMLQVEAFLADRVGKRLGALRHAVLMVK
jgi:IS5 family transposase